MRVLFRVKSCGNSPIGACITWCWQRAFVWGQYSWMRSIVLLIGSRTFGRIAACTVFLKINSTNWHSYDVLRVIINVFLEISLKQTKTYAQNDYKSIIVSKSCSNQVVRSSLVFDIQQCVFEKFTWKVQKIFVWSLSWSWRIIGPGRNTIFLQLRVEFATKGYSVIAIQLCNAKIVRL